MIRTIISFTNTCKGCHKLCKTTNQMNIINRYSSFLDKFDPPYLDSLKPKIPEYEAINVQMKGYDFVILESYQSLVHRIAKAMDIEVEDGWATPAAVTNIKKFKPNSANIECEYTLSTYERNIQIVGVPSIKIGLFLEIVQTILPQGINLSVHEHQPEHEEIRYVPDYELIELKSQLEDYSQKKK